MSGKKKIIIVDDDENLRKMIKIRLELKNYSVLEADSGESALELINNEKPDLILLDIAMPDMDGYEVCKLLKDNEDTKNIPIVFLTGIEGNIENKLQGLMVGGADYIQKPFDGKELVERIEKILHGG